MQIKFVRSGGFAGPATRVEGTLDLKGPTPTVHSKAADYQRELSTQEAEQLRCAVDASVNCPPAGTPHQPTPDGLQYDVTISTADGKSQTITAHPGAKSGAKAGEAGMSPELMAWIQEEARKIWNHRLSKR